jgi:hypothetical protein
VLRASGAGSLPGTDVLFATASPNGILVRGHLAGTLPAPAGDADGDGVQDALDVCPLLADAAQADANGDGIGNPCQCGDVSNDGLVTWADVTALRAFLAGSGPLPAPQKCDVGGAGCDVVDAVRLRRALASLAPPLAQACPPDVP